MYDAAITDFTNARDYARAVGMQLASESNLEVGQIYVANDSRFTSATFNQPLTNFAVGGWNQVGLDAELRAYVGAPVQVSRRFNYKVWTNADYHKSETSDDLRAIGAEFKEVRRSNSEVNTQVANRGLVMVLDKDELAEGVITEQMAVSYLTERLKLNQIRRASALLIAAANNTGRAWYTTGTPLDPDLNIQTALNAYQTATGIDANTVIFGRFAWTGRLTMLRSLTSAGGFAGSAITSEAELASYLNIDQVYRANAVYQSATATKTVVGTAIVLAHYKSNSGMREDPSNIKYFWAPTTGGGQVSAFRYEEGSKKIVVGVEHNELLAITYSSGIQTITVT